MTPTLLDGPEMLACLNADGLLPQDAVAVFCVGSVARGWANEGSDYDIAVIVPGSRTPAGTSTLPVPLEPAFVPVHVGYSAGRRWEVKYWTDSQVDQMLAKVSHERFESGQGVTALLTMEELFLERLLTCLPLSGEEWIRRRCEDLRASAYQRAVLTRTLGNADSALEDAIGQLASGDPDSAVISAHKAFVSTVDAILESAECYGSGTPKWRSRRMRDAAPPALAYEQYWAMETMTDLDPEAPEKWVMQVVSWCRETAMGVEIS
jgi:Nucleotidyltransferase domain